MTLKLNKWTLSASLMLLIVSARLCEGQPKRDWCSATGGGEEYEYDSNDDDADESADSLEQRIRNYPRIPLSPLRVEQFQAAFERNRISEALSVIQEEQTELTDSLLSAQSQQQSDYHDRLGEILDFRWLVNKFAESSNVHSGSAAAVGNQSTVFSGLYCNESSLDKMGAGSLQSAGPASMPAVSQSMASFDDTKREIRDQNLSPKSAKKQSNAEQSASRENKAKDNQEKQSELYPSCRNSRGQEVDWFITIKSNMYWNFLSMTSEGFERNMDVRTSGPVWNTLTQALKIHRKPFLIVITYNDQPPDGKSSQGYAHAKGVVVFDKSKKRGFWIVHSVPNFPVLDTGVLVFPAKARYYAQSFGCSAISNSHKFEGVVAHLKSMKVYCYGDTNYYYKSRPINWIPEGYCLSEVHLGTIEKVFHVAKVNTHNCCIYCELSQHLDANMLTETWTRKNTTAIHVGGDKKVFGFDYRNGFKYTVGQDHSKWSVSNNHRRPFVCVGDLNRQITARGGGVLCIESESAQQFFCRAARNANGQPFECV